MADIKLLTKKHISMRTFMFIVGFLCIASALLLLTSMSKVSTEGNAITAMVAGSDVVPAGHEAGSASTNISSLIYFVGFVLFGGVLFVVSRYSTELKSVLKVEKDKQEFTTTPKAALEDFFGILIDWNIKNSNNTQAVYILLQKMRRENTTELPLLDSIDFRLDGNRDDIDVSIGTMPEWEQLYDVFRFFLKELEINREKFMHIAEYLGKDDVVIILNRLDEVQAKNPDKDK
jgi:hypothetical protein